MKLVIASHNQGKIVEIKKSFFYLDTLQLLSLNDFEKVPEVIEDGKTFAENALKKGKVLFEYTKMPTLADDSGLVIKALNGRPGVYSARYGGEKTSFLEKNKLILQEMKDFKDLEREAKFVCVMALVLSEEKFFLVEGECLGQIALKPEGTNGFGYDPIFFLPSYKKTMAQISIEEKNKISHRAQALEKIKKLIGSF